MNLRTVLQMKQFLMENVTALMELIELTVFAVYVSPINFTTRLIKLAKDAHKIVSNVQIK